MVSMISLLRPPTVCAAAPATSKPTEEFNYYYHHLPASYIHLRSLPSLPLPPSPPPSSHHRRVRVAFQGSRGSYCHEAAALAYPWLEHEHDDDDGEGEDSRLLPCPSSLDSAFSAVDSHHLADVALVPIENSLDGIIPRNLDLLLRHPDLRIVGELLLPVNHCLLSPHPAALPRRVLAHPQAISHCRTILSAMDLEILEVSNPADAARHLAETRDPDTAVIGSRMAASEFGLSVVHRNLQDDEENFTRFLQLGFPSSTAVGCCRKTAVAFALERGPTDMFRAMSAFETRGVRVNRFDHRPNRVNTIRIVNGSKIGYLDYVFMLEVEGGENDANVRSGVEQLRDLASFVRVLGSYGTCEA